MHVVEYNEFDKYRGLICLYFLLCFSSLCHY